MSPRRYETTTTATTGPHAPPFLVSLDIGTSSIRGTVYDRRGLPLPDVRVVRRQDVRFDEEGAAVLDADRAVEQVVQVLEELVSLLDAPPAAVAVDTFWHSLMGVDNRGKAITPVTLWADRRAVKQARFLQEQLDAWSVSGRTGCPMHPSYPLARILWLRETWPAGAGQIHRLLTLGDYLMLRLFGEFVTSPSLASGWGLFNLIERTWDPALTALLDVDPDRLPRVVPDRLWQAPMRSPYRERLRKWQGVPWLLPVGDGAADSMGAGSYLPDRITVMIGSSGATRLIRPGPPDSLLPPAPGLWTYLVRDDLPLTGGSLSNGGKLVEWALRTLRLDTGAASTAPEQAWMALDQALKERSPDAHGLTVLPFWAGERSPGWHLDAAGSIRGLRLTTLPLDLIQAILESIAYRFAVIHRRLKDEGLLSSAYTVAATGSALTRLPAWMQILADVLGVPVARPSVGETTARGAVLLTLDALGLGPVTSFPPPEAAAQYEPNPERHERYRTALKRHEGVYEEELEQ